MIHTLTAFPSDYRELSQPGEHRVFGYFLSRAEAVDAVSRNEGSMGECYYTHLVIEAIRPGINSIAGDEAWFYYDQGAWHPCDQPEWARQVCNHAMG